MKPEEEFDLMMQALASMVGPPFVLTPQMMELYDRLLSPLGYGVVVKALQEIIQERSSRDPFPSIKEIREKILPEVDPETRAIAAANRIIQAVGSYGYNNLERARESLGPEVWPIVKLFGGWENICRMTGEVGITTIRAQLRDLARAHQKMERAQAPALTSSEPVKQLGSSGFSQIGDLVKLPAPPARKGEQSHESENQSHQRQKESRDEKGR